MTGPTPRPKRPKLTIRVVEGPPMTDADLDAWAKTYVDVVFRILEERRARGLPTDDSLGGADQPDSTPSERERPRRKEQEP